MRTRLVGQCGLQALANTYGEDKRDSSMTWHVLHQLANLNPHFNYPAIQQEQTSVHVAVVTRSASCMRDKVTSVYAEIAWRTMVNPPEYASPSTSNRETFP